MGKCETKDIVIPTLRNSSPTVKLVVQHVNRVMGRSQHDLYPQHLHTSPASCQSGAYSSLPQQRSQEEVRDMLLPEAIWSDMYTSSPIGYRFGTVILPAPDWIRWSDTFYYVTLTRLSNGFGFSIMDYKDPKDTSEGSASVLIIRQITPFGAADLEGHLALGERIMAVNKEIITTHSISDIVTLIKPSNILQLKMTKPVETKKWRKLLSTNISTMPLVSGTDRTSPCSSDMVRSTSTLNVRPFNSTESLPLTDSVTSDTMSRKFLLGSHRLRPSSCTAETDWNDYENTFPYYSDERRYSILSEDKINEVELTDINCNDSVSMTSRNSLRRRLYKPMQPQQYQDYVNNTNKVHPGVNGNVNRNESFQLPTHLILHAPPRHVSKQSQRQEDLVPRAPPRSSNRRISEPLQSLNNRNVRSNGLVSTYQHTFPNALSGLSAADSSDVLSIQSSVSGINNTELTDLWRSRAHNAPRASSRNRSFKYSPSQQLSHV